MQTTQTNNIKKTHHNIVLELLSSAVYCFLLSLWIL